MNMKKLNLIILAVSFVLIISNLSDGQPLSSPAGLSKVQFKKNLPFSSDEAFQDPQTAGETYSSDEINHSFVYIDLELLSPTLGSEGSMHSGVFLDWITGKSVFHGGFLGGYLGPEFLIYELGYSYVLDSKDSPSEPTTQILYKGRDLYYEYYEKRIFMAKALKLRLFDIGVRVLSPLYFWDTIPESSSEVFGESFDDVDEIEYYANDKIFYLGYRVISFRDAILTKEEYLWSIQGLLGISDRHAKVWHAHYIEDVGYTTVEENGDVKIGMEISGRWHMFQSRIGFYDSWFYFNIGWRLAFDKGM